jgi:hypothetical protein
MKFPTPVGADDVVNNGGLPPELQGKTPAEIAAYYADRESTILDNARRMVNEARESNNNPPPPTGTTPPGTPDPKFVTQEQLANLTASAQAGLIQMAQMTASTGKGDWNRLLPEIKKIVESLPAAQQINSEIWSEAYYNVRGRMTDTFITEARNIALGLEPPSAPPPPAAKPRVYTPGELSVIEGCGITPEMYADAETKLQTGYQPFTTDNRRGRK